MHATTLSRRSLLLGGAGCALALAVQAQPAGDERFYGVWSGTLLAGSRTLPVRFEISLGPSARLVSVAENSSQAADSVTVHADEIELRFKSIMGRFEGRMVAPDRIEGTWHQTLYHLPLKLTRGQAEPPTRDIAALTVQQLAAIRRRNSIPALGAAWQAGSGECRVLVDGVRSAGASVAVTPGDRWHLGSLSKSMTATLIATAVAAGQLRWTDTVAERLDSVIPGGTAAAGSITLLQLLSHRSGLQANLPDSDLATFALETPDIRRERLAFASRALALPPAAAPGETFLYSNLGYVVAAAMLETASGESWETLMRQRVFEPLQLASAGFGPPGHPGQLDEPVGHRQGALATLLGNRRRPVLPGNGVRADNVAAMGPAGRVHMSLPDLCRYLQAHRDRNVLFDRTLWEVLHTPPFGGSYALGWERHADGGLWHNGSNTLWYAEALIDGNTVSCAVANDGVLGTTSPAVGEVLLGAREAARTA